VSSTREGAGWLLQGHGPKEEGGCAGLLQKRQSGPAVLLLTSALSALRRAAAALQHCRAACVIQGLAGGRGAGTGIGL
jgi:hypothetical protein